MKKIVVTLSFIVVMFLTALAFGQEATVAKPEAKRPELSKEATQTLELAIARLENYDLKIKVLEQERDTIKGAAQQYLESLKIEGYNLIRTPQGKWEYTKVAK